MKCAFVLPYFGKFNNYFPLFLKSCAKNLKYDWIIYTDDKTSYKYPPNVHVHYTTFEKIKSLCEKKLQIDISLEKPYKLCDFKPAYGLVFEDDLKNYDYWGHCDCDVIFGDMDQLLTPLLNQGYDKLFAAGHLTVYKNTYENVRRFMKKYHNRSLYKEFLTVPEICWFDEDWKSDNVHSLFIEDGAKVCCEFLAYNPSGNYLQFIQRTYNSETRKYVEENKNKSICYWDDGTVGVYDLKTKFKTEYLYVHLQHRKMTVKCGVEESNSFVILPNEFCKIDRCDCNTLERINPIPLSAYIYLVNRFFKRVKRKLKIGERKDDSQKS